MPHAPKAPHREGSAEKPREADKSHKEESPHEVDWQLGLGLKEEPEQSLHGESPGERPVNEEGSKGGGRNGSYEGPDQAESHQEESGSKGSQATTRAGGSGAEMRLVQSRRDNPARAHRTNYARMGAATLAAKIQFVMPPSGQVTPALGAEVRIMDTREVKTRHGSSVTGRTFGVFTSASATVVEWAREVDRFDERRPVRENAFLWALTEFHEENWVQARRLFAAAGEPKWSRHCLHQWSARSLRTFPREIEFPSIEYESFAEYGEEMGAFYYGSRWKRARPRRSRRPLWPGV
jgi:hypothetical protein